MNNANFMQWSRRYKLVAGAEHAPFKTPLEWVEAQNAIAPVVDANGSGSVGAQKASQHIHASLPMRKEVGTDAHSIMAPCQAITDWRHGER